MNILFNSKVKQIGSIGGIRTIEQISNEPHFYSCSPEFILDYNAPIHKEIIEKIKLTKRYKKPFGYNEVIDSRVTQTMGGMYPSIPGWHCDNIPRNGYGQPDISKIDNNIQHFMCLISSCENHTETIFAIGEYNLDIDHDNLWSSVDKKMNNMAINMLYVKAGNIYNFNQQSLHCARPTINPGWRLFFRLSFLKEKPKNQIRKQVQIYTQIGQGW